VTRLLERAAPALAALTSTTLVAFASLPLNSLKLPTLIAST
jgi:hypothetical protein